MTDSFKWGTDIDFKIDGSTGSIVDITAYTNSASIQGGADILDVTAFGATGPGVQHGLARCTIPVNGFVNSTTEGIFGPLVGNRTSVLKTVGFYNGIKWYTGEFLPENVEFSGDPASLIAWSCNLTINGTVTRTSVTPS
jgi:hypothetical protein